MTPYLGDFPANAIVRFPWSTNDQGGASVTRSVNGSIRVYKNSSTAERSSSNGITDTEDFDSLTGVHHLAIDTSDNSDASFYAAGNDYFVVLAAATIDGKVVNHPLFSFSIENRAFRGNVVQWNGSNVATPDSAGHPKVTIKTGTGPGELSLTSGGVLVASMASNVITSATLAGSAITAIQSGLSTLDAAGVRTAIGMGQANLDAQLAAIAAYIDTEVAAIKAKTDNLPNDPASAGTISTSFSTQAATLSAIAAALATCAADVLLVKAKTDNLPSDPADASVITGQVNSILAAIAAISALVEDCPSSNVTIANLDGMLQNGPSGYLFTAYALSNVSGDVTPPVPSVLPVYSSVGTRRSGTLRLGLGSTVPIREETLLRDDGKRYNLSGVYQVYYELVPESGTESFVFAEGEVYGDPLTGKVRYTWAVGDLSERGVYRERWHLYFTEGTQVVVGGLVSVE